MNEGIVQARFRAVFPNHWIRPPRSRYTRLEYGIGASIYFRDSEHGNVARINRAWVGRFPSELEHYLEAHVVPRDNRDYLIGAEHVEGIIAILRDDG